MVTETTYPEGTVSERILKGLEPYYGVEKVYGTPIEKGDMTVLPAARIKGGGGGGGGGGSTEEMETGSGEGGGFGIASEPAGVYVITNDGVEWKPAIDTNRMVANGAATLIALFLFVWLGIRSRSRA